MERKNNIFFIVITIVFLLSILIFKSPILDKNTIPASFHLTKNPGFDHADGELRFGGIPINQSASRKLELVNTFNRPIMITIESTGEITEQLIVSENNFELLPNESKNISFTVYTSGLTEFREYFGEIIILSKKI
ncbi:hypothetical protein KAS08_00865 [Candidatus Pacearchaeota archaeon]|nr:hypothetical protein [Candidatus Pacearchaeota archaeon]